MIGSNNCVDPHRFPHGLDLSNLMDKGGIISTNEKPQQGGRKNARVERSRPDHSVGDMFEREFRARFCILDTIPILLIDGEALLLVELSNNMIYFTNE